MKVLVTGANGYLGQGVVKHILDCGHSVVAADIATEHVDDRAQKIPCDLFSLQDPYSYFGEPDILLHCCIVIYVCYLFLLAATHTGSSLITGLLTAITPERLCGT